MKTTIDLPADIVKAMKMKAARENRKLKEVAADLLREGLWPSPVPSSGDTGTPFHKHPKTGHPVVRSTQEPREASLSVEESYDLLQDLQTSEDLERVGRPL